MWILYLKEFLDKFTFVEISSSNLGFDLNSSACSGSILNIL